MSTPTAALKRAAKEMMHGKLLLCVVGACVPIFTVIVGELFAELILYTKLSWLIYVGLFLVMIPLLAIPVFMGALRFFWKCGYGTRPNPAEIFYYFSDRAEYRRVLRWGFSVFRRIFRVALVSLSPSVIALAFSQKDIYNEFHWAVPHFLPLISALYVVLSVAGWIVCAVYALRYYMIPYLLIRNPELIDEEIAFRSEKIYHATAGRTIRYVLSYWPWILLSLLVFPLVFTLPYFFCGYLTYCRFSLGEECAEQRTDAATDRKGESL